MKNFRLHHFSFILMVLSVATLSQALALVRNHAVAQTTTQCSTGTFVSVGASSGTNTAVVNGQASVAISVSPTLAPTVKSVTFYLDNEPQVLGWGVRVLTNPSWQMQWYSQVSPPGNHTVGAVLSLTSGSCLVTPAAVNVAAQPAEPMNVGALPASFEGYTNEPRNFSLKTGLGGASAADITQWTVYQVGTTNLGVVTQDAAGGFRFSSGTVPGTGAINVVAKYGGVSRTIDIPVVIKASTTTQQATLNGPTPTSTPGTAQTPAPGTDAAKATDTPEAQVVQNTLPTDLKGDQTVKSCVVAKVGQQRYDVIIAGTARPSAQEFEAFQICFASRNYVLPVGWVPVEPKKETIKAQPTSDEVKVAKAQTITTEANGSKKQALKFSGVAKPNAKILLYIFSEPLVVSTDTNANGEWSYSLEDPMDPGKHEAYAMVNKGDGTYERSSVFNFAIAKVEAAAANPNGLSLNLEGNQPTAAKNNRSLAIYVIAVVLAVLAGGVALWWLIRRHKPHDAGPVGTVLQPSTITPEKSDAAAKDGLGETGHEPKAEEIAGPTAKVTSAPPLATDVLPDVKPAETASQSSQNTVPGAATPEAAPTQPATAQKTPEDGDGTTPPNTPPIVS